MSKGLEALQRLFDHNYGEEFYIKAEEDAEIIEKELKEYYKLKEEIMKCSCWKEHKAVQIMKKYITLNTHKYESEETYGLADYMIIIPKEEYDLLKEVLL